MPGGKKVDLLMKVILNTRQQTTTNDWESIKSTGARVKKIHKVEAKHKNKRTKAKFSLSK